MWLQMQMGCGTSECAGSHRNCLLSGRVLNIKLFFGLLACRPSKEDKMDRPKESLLDSQKVPVDIEKEARRLKMQNIVVSLQCISG